MQRKQELTLVRLLLNLDEFFGSDSEHTQSAYIQLRNYLMGNHELINMSMPSFSGEPPLAYYMAMKPNGRWLLLHSPLLQLITDETLNYMHDGRSVVANLCSSDLFLKVISIDRVDNVTFNYCGDQFISAACVIMRDSHNHAYLTDKLIAKMNIGRVAEVANLSTLANLTLTTTGKNFLLQQPELLLKLNYLMKENTDQSKASNMEFLLSLPEHADLNKKLTQLKAINWQPKTTPSTLPVCNEKLRSAPLVDMSEDDECMLMMLLNHIKTNPANTEDGCLAKTLLRQYLLKNPELLNMRLSSDYGRAPFALYLAGKTYGRSLMMQQPFFGALTLETLNYRLDTRSIVRDLCVDPDFQRLLSQRAFADSIDDEIFNSSGVDGSPALILLKTNPALFVNQTLFAKVDMQALLAYLKKCDLEFFSKALTTQLGANLLFLHIEFRKHLNTLLKTEDKEGSAHKAVVELLKQPKFDGIRRMMNDEGRQAIEGHVEAVAPAAVAPQASVFEKFSDIKLRIFGGSDAPQDYNGYKPLPEGPGNSKRY